jgi:hypothetical protein
MAGVRFSDELPIFAATTFFRVDMHADIGITTLMLFKAFVD